MRKLLIIVIAPIALFFALDWLFPFPKSALHRAPAIVVFDRNGDPMRIVLPPDQKVRIPVTLHELPPELVRAVITSEDRWFWRHPGVNPLAIARALRANVTHRRRVSGASTIPMQIARMAEPKSRTIFAKVLEAFRAIQLTLHTTKREQLEAYFNMAPYGGNVEGIGAASRVYFGKEPSQLSIGEIAFLTTLPRQPNRFDPLRDHDTAIRARDRVLRQLRDRGAFTTAEITDAMRQPLPRARQKAPFVAPHFCDYAIAQAPGRTRIFTTLDPRIQKIAEQQVESRIGSLRAYGVEETAVVVIDNQTSEVVAMVGSANFFDAQRQGQVNGAVARRSPGSMRRHSTTASSSPTRSSSISPPTTAATSPKITTARIAAASPRATRSFSRSTPPRCACCPMKASTNSSRCCERAASPPSIASPPNTAFLSSSAAAKSASST
jgi:penicillin-binding protein 1C